MCWRGVGDDVWVFLFLPVPPHLKMHVQGRGPIADMYRALIGLFDPLAANNIKIDTTPCLPNPSVPDFSVYKEIG